MMPEDVLNKKVQVELTLGAIYSAHAAITHCLMAMLALPKEARTDDTVTYTNRLTECSIVLTHAMFNSTHATEWPDTVERKEAA